MARDGEILIVEDEEGIREMVQIVVEAEGYLALTAANGREAIKVLSGRAPPCLILLDLMMPEMDGWQFLQEMEKVPEWAEVPVVVLTAYGEKAPPSGVIGILRKPVELDALLSTLRIHCPCSALNTNLA